MYTAAIVIHIIVSVVIVVTVLLSSGKGASMGSSFGGAGSQALFGSAGPAGMMTKITAAAAIIFMCTSVYITYVTSHRGEASIMRSVPTVTEAPDGADKDAAKPTDLIPTSDDVKGAAQAPAKEMEAAPAEKIGGGEVKEEAPALKDEPAPAKEEKKK